MALTRDKILQADDRPLRRLFVPEWDDVVSIRVLTGQERDAFEGGSLQEGRHFTELLAYYGLEPWGEERADLRAGIVASTLANCHRDPKKRPFEPRDFMPDFEPKKRPTQAQLRQKIAAWVQAMQAVGAANRR